MAAAEGQAGQSRAIWLRMALISARAFSRSCMHARRGWFAVQSIFAVQTYCKEIRMGAGRRPGAALVARGWLEPDVVSRPYRVAHYYGATSTL